MVHLSRALRQRAQPGDVGALPTNGSLGVPGLVLVGIGGIIGAGFFLGAGLPIRTAGPAVLLAFLFGALITAQVTGALASLAVADPQPGAFVTYAERYVGPFAGFVQGWTYYVGSVLTITSEAAAMAVFSRIWAPSAPAWILTCAYAAVVLLMNAFGVRNFTRIESLMTVMKLGALVGFVVFVGTAAIAEGARGTASAAPEGVHATLTLHGFFAAGGAGVFQSMLIVIFAYAGIGVFATAAAQTARPRDIDRAAWITVASLAGLYLTSIALVLRTVSWRGVSLTASPFVVALERLGAPLLGGAFNLIILVASFSVMAGCVFSANQILLGLAEAGQAPPLVRPTTGVRTQAGPLAVTSAGVALAVLVAYLLPADVYGFLISASGFLSLLNWFLILWAFLGWRGQRSRQGRHVSSLAFGQPASTPLTMLVLVVLAAFATTQPEQRLGFYAFAILTAAVGACYGVLRWRRSVPSPKAR